MKKRSSMIMLLLLMGCSLAYGAGSLRLNPRLDYDSDSQDGPLITGDHMDDGVVAGKPNYVIMYGEG